MWNRWWEPDASTTVESIKIHFHTSHSFFFFLSFSTISDKESSQREPDRKPQSFSLFVPFRFAKSFHHFVMHVAREKNRRKIRFQKRDDSKKNSSQIRCIVFHRGKFQPNSIRIRRLAFLAIPESIFANPPTRKRKGKKWEGDTEKKRDDSKKNSSQIRCIVFHRGKFQPNSIRIRRLAFLAIPESIFANPPTRKRKGKKWEGDTAENTSRRKRNRVDRMPVTAQIVRSYTHTGWKGSTQISVAFRTHRLATGSAAPTTGEQRCLSGTTRLFSSSTVVVRCTLVQQHYTPCSCLSCCTYTRGLRDPARRFPFFFIALIPRDISEWTIGSAEQNRHGNSDVWTISSRFVSTRVSIPRFTRTYRALFFSREFSQRTRPRENRSYACLKDSGGKIGEFCTLFRWLEDVLDAR